MEQTALEQSGWKLVGTERSLPASIYSVAAIKDFAEKRFELCQRVTVLGRDPGCCDVALPGSHVSRRHAELVIRGNQLHVRDLSSSNGTYVNNVRVSDAMVMPGDEIRFDQVTLKVLGPDDDPDKTVIHPRARAKLEDTEVRPSQYAVSTAPRLKSVLSFKLITAVSLSVILVSLAVAVIVWR